MLASPQHWEFLQVPWMGPQLSWLLLACENDCSGLQPEFLFFGSALSFRGWRCLAKVMLAPETSDACSQEVLITDSECRGGLCCPVRVQLCHWCANGSGWASWTC